MDCTIQMNSTHITVVHSGLNVGVGAPNATFQRYTNTTTTFELVMKNVFSRIEPGFQVITLEYDPVIQTGWLAVPGAPAKPVLHEIECKKVDSSITRSIQSQNERFHNKEALTKYHYILPLQATRFFNGQKIEYF